MAPQLQMPLTVSSDRAGWGFLGCVVAWLRGGYEFLL